MLLSWIKTFNKLFQIKIVKSILRLLNTVSFIMNAYNTARGIKVVNSAQHQLLSKLINMMKP